jgi:hypothetical protein
MPLARDVVRDLAVSHGGCIRPVQLLVGHVSTTVTEIVYRHEIRPALTKGATAMDKIFKKKRKSA